MNEPQSTCSALIVDDDVELCEAIAAKLQTSTLRVETSHDGGEALKRLKARSYDVLVSDIRMPGMDGIHLLRKVLREVQPAPAIFIMTGFSDLLSKDDAIRAGAKGLYTKGEVEVLIRDIQTYCGKLGQGQS